MIESLAAGQAVRASSQATIADGLAAPFAGVLNFAHVRARVDRMVAVSDAEIVDAMRVLMERAKVVPEPAGAAATAALLSGRLDLPPGARVVSVVSGGNVDLARLAALLG
jgi:threonine dehydratase